MNISIQQVITELINAIHVQQQQQQQQQQHHQRPSANVPNH